MLEIRELTVNSGEKTLLEEVSLNIYKQGVIGLTGSSGAGKTTLIKAIMGILDEKLLVKGEILCDGERLMTMKASERRKKCGTVIGFIPQNPMTAFDPYRKISSQMSETICSSLHISKEECKRRVMKVFEKINLHNPERVYDSFPSQLSGGMLQRITIAFLLIMKPEYILADEPTSALDEENRQILVRLLKKISRECGILMISHDIKSLNALCEVVYVMEFGKLTTVGKLEVLLLNPPTEWLKVYSQAWEKQKGGEIQWKDYR